MAYLIKGFGLLTVVTLLALTSCQSGQGSNPCLSQEWADQCGSPQPLLLSPPLPKVTSSARPTAESSKIPIPSPIASPTTPPTESSSPPIIVSPSPSVFIPTTSSVHKLSLGPSVFTFSGPQEETPLVGFAFDQKGLSIPLQELNLIWKSSQPDLFSVNEQGVVTTLKNAYSGNAVISVMDPQTGITARMNVTIGRGGGGSRQTSNTNPEIVPNTIQMVSPARPRFTPSTPLSLQALFSTSEQTFQQGVKVVFYDENDQIIGESTNPMSQTNTRFSTSYSWETPPLGEHLISAHLLSTTEELLAKSEPIALNISNFGLTSYYVNTTTDHIYAINLNSFEITNSTAIPGSSPGFPSPGSTIDALAKQPLSGRVYYEGRSGSSNNRLFYWDPTEGTEANAHHYVGEVIETVSGNRRNVSMMTFNTTTAKLYGFGLTDGNYELFEIDPATGSVSLISLTPINGSTLPNTSGGDLAADRSGNLYIVTGNRIYKIELETDTSATVDLLGSILRVDNGNSVGSISSLGFDTLNRPYIIGTYNSSVLLYGLQSDDITQATELLNFTQQNAGLLNGITSSGGDFTSTHD